MCSRKACSLVEGQGRGRSDNRKPFGQFSLYIRHTHTHTQQFQQRLSRSWSFPDLQSEEAYWSSQQLWRPFPHLQGVSGLCGEFTFQPLPGGGKWSHTLPSGSWQQDPSASSGFTSASSHRLGDVGCGGANHQCASIPPSPQCQQGSGGSGTLTTCHPPSTRLNQDAWVRTGPHSHPHPWSQWAQWGAEATHPHGNKHQTQNEEGLVGTWTPFIPTLSLPYQGGPVGTEPPATHGICGGMSGVVSALLLTLVSVGAFGKLNLGLTQHHWSRRGDKKRGSWHSASTRSLVLARPREAEAPPCCL